MRSALCALSARQPTRSRSGWGGELAKKVLGNSHSAFSSIIVPGLLSAGAAASYVAPFTSAPCVRIFY